MRFIGEQTFGPDLQSITIPENFAGTGLLILSPFYYFTKLQTIVWNAICFPKAFSDRYSGTSYFGLGLYNNDIHKNRAPNIKEVRFGEKVTIIPDYLCYNLSNLQDLVIPKGVTSIGKYAFARCSGLTKLTIPDAVTAIGTNAFYLCTGLTEVTIGKKVVSIGGIFVGCDSLKTIYCKAPQPPINVSFPSSVSVIYVPRESVNEYRAMWSNYASKILGYDFE